MDNFSPAQYERFEAYRRHALPKHAVRKVWFRGLFVWYGKYSSQVLGHSTSHWPASVTTGCANCGRFFQGVRWRDCGEGYVLGRSTAGNVMLIRPLAARQVQARRGETGPLSPDHLREAYRMYQEETGRVGAARPLRSKRLFVR